MKTRIFLCLLVLAAWVPAFAAVETFTFSSVDLDVPDGPSYGASDTHSISSTILSITSVRVTLNVSGSYNGDLYVNLQHSSGLSVLLNRVGRTAGSPFGSTDAGFDITLDDAAATDVHSASASGGLLTGTWQPDARNVDPADAFDTSTRSSSAFLSAFDSMDADGDWTLFLADIEYGAANTLNSWELEITGLDVIPEPANVALGIFGALAAGWAVLRRLRSSSRAKVK